MHNGPIIVAEIATSPGLNIDGGNIGNCDVGVGTIPTKAKSDPATCHPTEIHIHYFPTRIHQFLYNNNVEFIIIGFKYGFSIREHDLCLNEHDSLGILRSYASYLHYAVFGLSRMD